MFTQQLEYTAVMHP